MTSRDVEQAFLGSLREQTGRGLEEWMEAVAGLGLHDRNLIVSALKERFDLSHLCAQLIAGVYLNSGKPVYGNPLAPPEEHAHRPFTDSP